MAAEMNRIYSANGYRRVSHVVIEDRPQPAATELFSMQYLGQANSA